MVYCYIETNWFVDFESFLSAGLTIARIWNISEFQPRNIQRNINYNSDIVVY